MKKSDFRDENKFSSDNERRFCVYRMHPFIILIDEWDCLFREYQQRSGGTEEISGFSAGMAEGSRSMLRLAYMTGILPIKKYGSHSALNMFTEYSMTDPGDVAEYFGFTEEEVDTALSEIRV